MIDVYTIGEAARILKISERAARDLVLAGELPASLVGDAYRLTDKDIAAYLDGHKVTPEYLAQLKERALARACKIAAARISAKEKTGDGGAKKRGKPRKTDTATPADNSMAESTTEGATPEQADSPITTEAEKEGL